MGQSSIKYVIESINDKYNYYKCVETQNSKSIYYLNFNQLDFVNIIGNDIDDIDDDINEEIKQEQDNRNTSNTIYSLTQNEEEDYENLSKYLPYFSDFMTRKEKSVLNQTDFKDDPSGYLKAIRNKYNIRHPRQFEIDNNHSNNNNIRPWIEGKMEKLMAQTGYFGTEKWKTRLFRLFDEALIWFDDEPSFFKKLFNRRSSNKKHNNNHMEQIEDDKDNDNEYMTPFGVLPLAMITGLKTCDIDKMDGNLSEDELLRLELEIGDEGIIILKCHDFNQRIKWYECLHTAIFTVKRPLFTKDKDLWRITEPKVNEKGTSTSVSRQITKEDIEKNDEKRRKPMHIRMGQSLAFKLNDIKVNFGTPTGNDNESDIQIEIPDLDTSDRVPSLSNNAYSNSIKVL